MIIIQCLENNDGETYLYMFGSSAIFASIFQPQLVYYEDPEHPDIEGTCNSSGNVSYGDN